MAVLGNLLAIAEVFDEPNYHRERRNAFELSEEDFLQQYRLDIASVRALCEELKPLLEKDEDRGLDVIGVEDEVLVTLLFYGSGSFQRVLASNYEHGMSQASVSRCIERVTNAICNTYRDLISFPTDAVSIKKIKVCDNELRIQNVVARYPGSVHDSFIWRNRELHDSFAEGQMPGGYLLGDGGYPLQPWLMVPIFRPQSPAEEEFNTRHIRGRNVIERLNGVLKSRFRCLDTSGGSLCYTPGKVCRIIIACCILHNMCLANKIVMPQDNDIETNDDTGGEEYPNSDEDDDIEPDLPGYRVRQQLVQLCSTELRQ